MIALLFSLSFAHPQYSIGVEALKRKDLSVAERALQQCVHDEHHNIDCHWELGWVYWLKSDWEQVVSHWNIVRKIDPNYKTIQTHLPQAEAKHSTQNTSTLSAQEVTAIDEIYKTEGCINRSDNIRSHTQKYEISQSSTLFFTDCAEVSQGPLQGNRERLIILKKSNDTHYHVLSLPMIDKSNHIISSHRILEAKLEGGMIKSFYYDDDWKIQRRWNVSTFALIESTITNFSGFKKLDYKQGVHHKYK